MGRLNLNIPNELHEAFRVAIKQRDDITQTKFLLRCMRAYAEGKLWFESGHPRTRMDSDIRFAPDPVPITPTNVSRETPVPDVPVDTTEYVLNELGQRHPEGSIMRITEDDNGFLHDMGYTPWKPLGKAKK
jgi:hypothetical protein